MSSFPARRIVAPVACGCLAALLIPGPAHAVCRVVEPVAESGDPGVVFDPTTAVLYVVAPDQLVAWDCPLGAAPEALDVGLVGVAPADLPGFGDVGAAPGPVDHPLLEERPALAGAEGLATPDLAEGFAGPWLANARPLCDDGELALPVHDTVTHVVMRPALLANGGTAGLVMPLPARADVHRAPEGMFEAVDASTAAVIHETIEFVEDASLGLQCSDPHYSSLLDDVAAAPLALYGCGDAGGYYDEGAGYYGPGTESRETETFETEDGTVEYERIPAGDYYDVTILTASSMGALTAWLDANRFAHSEEDDAAFSHYVGAGRWFMALRVYPPELDGERLALTPLVISYRGESIPVMNRLQHDSRGGTLITEAAIVAPTRVAAPETEDAVTVSATRIAELAGPLRLFGVEGGWLTRMQIMRETSLEMEDTQLLSVPDDGADEQIPVIERRLRVRIAQACCEGNTIPMGGERTFHQERRYRVGEEPPDDTLFYRAPELAADSEACNYPSPYGEYDDYGYYACRVGRRGTAAALSWLPLLVALGVVLRRRRR